MKRLLVFLLFPLMGTSFLYGAGDPFQKEPVRKGINLIYDLRYDEAQKIFDQLKKDYPKSPVGYGMTALRAWHEFLFDSRNLAIYPYGMPTPIDNVKRDSGRTKSKKEQEFLDANEELNKFCDTVLKNNPEDTLALYFKGVYYENLSTHALTLDRAYGRSKDYAKKAAELHKEVLKKNPGQVDAQTSSAVLEYSVGSLNVFLRILLKVFFGLPGDREGAVKKLEDVMHNGIYRATDAQAVLALLEDWKGEKSKAISLFKNIRLAHRPNFMSDISLAAAYEGGDKFTDAIRIYEELLKDISSKSPGIQPGEIYYRMGKCNLSLKKYDLALENFKKAVNEMQRVPQTKPLAYYEMAHIYKKKGKEAEATDCYKQAVEFGFKDGNPTPFIEKEIKKAEKGRQ